MILKEIAFAEPKIPSSAHGCKLGFKIEVRVKKLSIAAAALAAATFLPASAFAPTKAVHPGAPVSSSVVKVADVYRPIHHYRRHRGCCVTSVYACWWPDVLGPQ
jgi:hypothetical protein